MKPAGAPGDPCADAGRELIGDIYLSSAELTARVTELGRAITADYEGREILLVSVLKGAIFFMADLVRCIDRPVEMDFMAISSYGESAQTSDKKAIRFVKDLERPIEDRDVIVVEDIVDTGLTLNYVLHSLSLRGPASLEVCTLLDRPYRRIADVSIRYSGFIVPDDFFVGYGFDYRQLYRNLPSISFLKI